MYGSTGTQLAPLLCPRFAQAPLCLAAVHRPAAGNDQDEYGFERGTRRRYALDVGRPLGALRRVFVQQVCGGGSNRQDLNNAFHERHP